MPDPKPIPSESDIEFARRTDFIYLASGSFLLFQLGEHRLGVPTRHIDTLNIIPLSELPDLPQVRHRDTAIAGIQLGVTVRVKDRNVRVRDLRPLFSTGPVENRKENGILLRHSSRLNRAPQVEGVIVDGVRDIQNFSKDRIEPFDGLGTPFPPLCLLGRVTFESRLWLLLHLDRLLEYDSTFPPAAPNIPSKGM